MEIICNQLSYHYPFTEKKKGITSFHFKFHTDQIYGLIGPSGSGKTTLLELLDMLKFPMDGTLQIGKDIITPLTKEKDITKLRRKVGYVFQFPEKQFFSHTVKEELSFALYSFSYRLREVDKRVKEALYMVGLDESYLERDPFELSHGEMRKIALASILIYNPKILLFDEPTIGMDAKSKKDFVKLIRKLKNDYKKLIIIVSHDLDFIHTLCDQICVLSNGEIVLSGNRYDVFTQVSKLKKYGVGVPKVIEFSYQVEKKKHVKMGYRNDINDLIKDIYRYVK